MFKICLSRFLQNKFYKIPKIIQNIEDFKIFDLYKNVSYMNLLKHSFSMENEDADIVNV